MDHDEITSNNPGSMSTRKKENPGGEQKKKNDFTLKTAIGEQYLKMVMNKDGENPIDVPPRFETFVSSVELYEFIDSILKYCKEVFKQENKQENLEEEANRRGLPKPKMLYNDKLVLHNLARQMASKYSLILIRERIFGNEKVDQGFFETLIIFISKVLVDAFDKNDLPKLQEELNRIFRSNAFNMTLRKQFEEQKWEKFPALREPEGKKERVAAVIERLEKRVKIPKESVGKFYIVESKECRPGWNTLKPHAAISARSPLISMLLPTTKDKINALNEKRRQNQCIKNKLVDKRQLTELVNEEFTRRSIILPPIS